jgi:hypothetical protein
MDKPRIKRSMIVQRHFPQTCVMGWVCASFRSCGYGITPQAAYSDWYRSRLASSSIDWMEKLRLAYPSPMHGGNPNADQP